jgi:hypothetical protein
VIPRHLQIALVLLLAGIFAVGLYALHLKQHAVEVESGQSERPVAPPVATAPEPVTLYIAYDGDGVLRKRTVTAQLPSEPTARAREILRTLLGVYLGPSSPHPLGAGSDVTEVFVVNNSLAVVDLNQAFADGHRSGVWEESLTVDSLVGTLNANMPNITQVKFVVNGQERETLAGHADLMSTYDAGQVDQLIQALQ